MDMTAVAQKAGRPRSSRGAKQRMNFRWHKATVSHGNAIARRFRMTLTDAVEAAVAFANTHPDFKGVRVK